MIDSCANDPIPTVHYTDSQLIAMPDKIASEKLSGEQIYDRARLLLEREGMEFVKRHEIKEPLNKSQENSKVTDRQEYKQHQERQHWY